MSLIYSELTESFFNLSEIREICCDRNDKCIFFITKRGVYDFKSCDNSLSCEKCNNKEEIRKYIKENIIFV